MKRFLQVPQIGIILCCMLATSAQAGGWANQNYSASTLGLAHAVVASADDVAAAAYNPAGLAWQDGWQVMGGVNYRYRDSSVVLGSGTASNSSENVDVYHAYASWMSHENPWGFSMAYNTPFDVDNRWGTTFPGISGDAVVQIDRLSVDAIYAVNSSLAFSMGADWYQSSAELSQGANAFQGKDDASFGFHAGMKWKFMPHWMLGATARKGVEMVLSGAGNTSAAFNIPDEWVIGIAHDMDDEFRLELDINRTAWSQMQGVNVTSGSTITQANALNLKDTLTVMTGLTWFWRENSQLRFGYAYDEGASNTSDFHPMFADQPGHLLSIGMGGDMMGVHFDVAYGYTFYSDVAATGAFAGTYRDRRQSLMLSISKGF